jgi:hypothetical protein
MHLPASGIEGARTKALVLLAVSAFGCGGPARDAAASAPRAAAAPVAKATSAAAVARAPLQIATSAPGELGPQVRFTCEGELLDNPGGPLHCLYNEPTPWREAEGRCVERGGHLVTVATEADQQFLLRAFGSPAGMTRFWIGLVEPSEGRWLWADGTRDRLSLWEPGEPNDDGRGENCGEWKTGTARWNDVDCETQLGYLCEGGIGGAGKARGLRCEGIAFQVGGHAYCLNGSEIGWGAAQKACLADGGNLAVLESVEENEALSRKFKSRVALTGPLWLGLTDAAEEGRFRWASGEPVDFEQWLGGEPNDFADEDCVEWHASHGGWNDIACGQRRASLCQETKAAMELRLGANSRL